MRTARTRSVARDRYPRLASLIARELELLATRHGRIVAFEVDEIDAVAEHLADLATSTSAPAVGLIDAREFAQLLGVARDWVYANADRLGGVRLGDGPRARLRFDAAELGRHWIAQWGRPAAVHRAAATPSRAALTERRYRRDPHPRQVEPVIADGPRSHAGIPSLDSQGSWILNDTWRIR